MSFNDRTQSLRSPSLTQAPGTQGASGRPKGAKVHHKDTGLYTVACSTVYRLYDLFLSMSLLTLLFSCLITHVSLYGTLYHSVITDQSTDQLRPE